MELKSKFLERREAYNASTKILLEGIQQVIAGIMEYMDSSSLYDRGGQLQWNDIHLLDKDVEEPIGVITGHVWYPIGAEVELDNGSKVKVSAETEPYFRKIMRVNIPLSILEADSKQDAIAYLSKMEEEAKKEESELRDALERGLAVIAGDDFDDTEEEVSAEDFDMSKLTPEQQAQLRKFGITGRG